MSFVKRLARFLRTFSLTPGLSPYEAISPAVSVFLRATRAYSLPASLVPVLLGTALAVRGYAEAGQAPFHGPAFLLVLLGAVLAHFGANVLNDYFDFVLGVDTRPEHGSGVLTSGQITAKQALTYGLLLMAGAGICGLLLFARPCLCGPAAGLDRSGLRGALSGRFSKSTPWAIC